MPVVTSLHCSVMSVAVGLTVTAVVDVDVAIVPEDGDTMYPEVAVAVQVTVAPMKAVIVQYVPVGVTVVVVLVPDEVVYVTE